MDWIRLLVSLLVSFMVAGALVSLGYAAVLAWRWAGRFAVLRNAPDEHARRWYRDAASDRRGSARVDLLGMIAGCALLSFMACAAALTGPRDRLSATVTASGVRVIFSYAPFATSRADSVIVQYAVDPFAGSPAPVRRAYPAGARGADTLVYVPPPGVSTSGAASWFYKRGTTSGPIASGTWAVAFPLDLVAGASVRADTIPSP